MNDLNYLVGISIQKFLITTRSDNAVGTVKGDGIVILATPFIWMEIWKDGSKNGEKKNERREGKDVKRTAIFSR